MNYSDDRVLLSRHDVTTSRFPAWIFVVVPLVAILFQVYVPLFFQFLGYLELPLIVTVYFALVRRSPISGLLIGAVIGLAQDSLSKNPLGMFGITKTLVGYIAASIGLRLDVEHSLIRFLLGFFSYVLHQFVFWILTRVLLAQQVNFEAQRVLVLGLLNALVAVSVFHFLDKLKTRA